MWQELCAHSRRFVNCILQYIRPTCTCNHCAHSRPRSNACSRKLGRHSTTAACGSCRSGIHRKQWVVCSNLFNKRCRSIGAWVCCVQATNIGEQHKRIGANAVRNKCGNAVVVAKANFVAGNGVVFVNDWHATKFEQASKSLARMQILRAVNEVVWHQQYLCANKSARRQILVVTIHQLALTNCSKCLQRLRISWALAHTECRDTTGNCTRSNDQHFM